MTTITAALNANDFSQATSLAADLMNGDQKMLDLISQANASATQAAADKKAALDYANGN